jgi:hypothetical protein
VQPNELIGTRDFYFPSELPFHGVVFSVGLSNQVLVIGSINFLMCKLENQSTNNVQGWSFTFSYLTNSLGQVYELSPRLERSKRNSDGGPLNNFNPGRTFSMFKVPFGTRREWTVPFVVGSELQESTFELISTQGVITEDCKYSWEIPANRISVEVVKRLRH